LTYFEGNVGIGNTVTVFVTSIKTSTYKQNEKKFKKVWYRVEKSNLLRGIFVSDCVAIRYEGIFYKEILSRVVVSYCVAMGYILGLCDSVFIRILYIES